MLYVLLHIYVFIKNPVKHEAEDEAFCEYSYPLKAINCFCKKLHFRSLTRFWIRLSEYQKLNVI